MAADFKRRPKRKLAADMNVVPYIDVMLVLLVIFMVTAPMLNQGVQVNLPKVSSNNLNNPNKAIIATISITASNNYYLNFSDQVITEHSANSQDISYLNDVTSQISHKFMQNSDLQVFVRADAVVPYAKAVELIAALQQIGIEQVSLITEEP